MKTHTTGYFSGKILIPLFLVLSLLLLLILSGCSAARVLHLIGVMSEDAYQSYIYLVNNDQLNPDGSYLATELEEFPESLPPEGSVHVTFAENAYMDVLYYRDANLTEPVDTKWCYLMPGDCIYAAAPSCEHPSSQWYKFDRFCIYDCDAAGKRVRELSWRDENDSSLVLRVPAEYAVSEISVVPLGKYEKRTLELTDYYIDSTGHRQELDGIWIINDIEISTGRAEVSPVESLSIDFKYDDAKYDFVESNPSSFYHEKGLVRFEITYADQEIEKYSVELRSLEGQFLFDPNQYPVANGTVIFQYNGRDIFEACYIHDGDSINYTAIPADGYRSAESAGQIFVNAFDPDKTDAAIKKAITFYLDENVTVSLPQPAVGGSIEYSANGKVLSGSTCSVPCGTVITMKFNHWDGWIVDANASKEYIVEPEANQSVGFRGSELGKLFTESDSHKPALNLILSETMKDADFIVSSSDNPQSNTILRYEAGSKTSIIPGQNDREIFGGSKVGTGSGIQLSVSNDTIFSGYAMKLEITAKDTKKNELQSIRYITDLPVDELIDLYDGQQSAAAPSVYESITIRASKVEVSTYSTRKLPNASITVTLVDESTPCILRDGDVLESSRDVEITITPDSGYYITGTKLNESVYRETMKYSKWEKEYEKILEKHPAQKIWYVTLDTTDSYGTCIYKLDSKLISSTTTVGIREGQNLTLEYTLSNPDYQISREGLGFISGLFHSTTESFSIPISELLDGQTIQRSSYITVVQKEG